MKRPKTIAETSRELREIRLNQPSLSPEEMRAQLEKNRSKLVCEQRSPKGTRSSNGREVMA